MCSRTGVGSVLRGEQDDRDYPIGLLCVLVVQREDARHLGPEGLALGRGRDTGAGGEPAGADLYPDARVRLEVLEPRRILVGAALGGDDDEVVPRGAVDQAGATWLAGPASGRGEHECVHAVRLVSLGSARGQIRAGVLSDPVPLRVGGAVEIIGDGQGGGPFWCGWYWLVIYYTTEENRVASVEL